MLNLGLLIETKPEGKEMPRIWLAVPLLEIFAN